MKSTARYSAKAATIRHIARKPRSAATPSAKAVHPTVAVASMSAQYTRGWGRNQAAGMARIAPAMAASGFTPTSGPIAAAARGISVSVTHVSETVQGTSIVAAATPRLVKQFVELPFALYAADPHWVP